MGKGQMPPNIPNRVLINSVFSPCFLLISGAQMPGGRQDGGQFLAM